MEKKKRILVVDDEPGILRFVRVSLTAAGYDVATADRGEEALRLVQSDNPDAVLLDILMVPMDGLEVLDKLRKFSQVPVIVFTARAFVAEQAMKLGANGFVSKPFRPEELVKRIEDTLDRHKQGD